MKTKKLICFGVAAALTASLCSCGTKEAKTSVEIDLTENKYGNTYPIQTDDRLSLWGHYTMDPEYKDFKDQPLWKELEKRTGITVDYTVCPGDAKEQFNLLIASGEYPDIIAYDWYDCYGNPSKAIQDNIIIPLNDVFEAYAPNLTAVLEELKDYNKYIMNDEGLYYGFPSLGEYTHPDSERTNIFAGPIVRKDLLDKYNIEIPTTLDEWHNMLTTFKNNGIKVPFTWEGKNLTYLGSNSLFFGAFGTVYDFYRDGDKIKYGPYEPQFKDALKLINQWYSEGLIDPEFVSIDATLLARKMTDGTSAVTLQYVSRLSKWTNETDYEYIGIPYPTINKGETPEYGQGGSSYGGTGMYAAITTQCDNVELAAKFLDYFYTPEGRLLFNYGIEGETYDMIDGVPTFKEYYLQNFDKLNPYTMTSQSVSEINRFDQRNREAYQQQALSVWTSNMAEHVIPPITPTPEESDELAAIETEIDTYVSEMVLKFITGYESFDNYDTFVETLKSMGIEDVLKVKQTQLDRFNNR